MAESLHSVRFPGESAEYREARNQLLQAEIELRERMESVARLRRGLPRGGRVPQDYEFEEWNGSVKRRTKLSELFAAGKDSLVVYSFMYGPTAEHACPMCTSFLDGLNGNAVHIAQRTNLVVIAKSPLARIMEYARGRGWSNLRLLSSEKNSYNRDYHGEDEKGSQHPALNVFTRKDGRIRHTWASELMFAPADAGQHPRHVDMMWPLWGVLDLTPEGRGTDWYPKLEY